MQSVAAAEASANSPCLQDSARRCATTGCALAFFFCWALFFPGALMGGGASSTHAQYSTEPYGCMQKSLPYAMLLGVILHCRSHS